MKQPVSRPPAPRAWATVAFAVGLVLGLFLLAGIAWANFEARLFYPSDFFTPGSKRERLRGLQCPLVVAQDETAQLRLRLRNPLDRPLRRFVRITVALRHVLLVDQDKVWLDFAPHETKTVTWDIPASEGVYGGWFLMTSVYAGATGDLAPGLNDCGIWVWPVRHIPGAWALSAAFGLAFGLMAAGLFPGGLSAVSGATRGLFAAYLVAWLAQVALRAWVFSAAVLALLALGLLMGLLQHLGGDDGGL